MSDLTFESLVRQLLSQKQINPQTFGQLMSGAGRTAGERAFSDTACLTRGLPWLSSRVNQDWLGRRFVLWPFGVPQFKWISITSSRLGARPDQQRRWFELLRTVMVGLDRATEGVVVVDSTSAADYVSRGAELFGVRTLRFVLPTESAGNDPVARWVQATARSVRRQQEHGAGSSAAADSVVGFVSPELDLPALRSGSPREEETCAGLFSGIAAAPLRDRLLFVAANRVVVLRCRPGGIVERLCSTFVQDERLRGVHLLVAADEPVLVRGLEEQSGNRVVRWVTDTALRSEPISTAVSGTSVASARIHAESPPPQDDPLRNPSAWLCHWTRAQPGPWCDQRKEDWLDELILGCQTADRSTLAALLRILSQRLIRSSSQGIRGDQAVVSLTSVPLSEFRSRRIYRRHRRRVDFELYGIAIRRSLAERLGARPVIYGDEATWQTLDATRRYLFQPLHAQASGQGGLGIDWSQEQEWRLPADLGFDDAAPGDVCCFVPTQSEADMLRHQPVPCLILPPETP